MPAASRSISGSIHRMQEVRKAPAHAYAAAVMLYLDTAHFRREALAQPRS